MNKIILKALIWLLLFAFKSNAQQIGNHISFNYNKGFALAHSNDVSHLGVGRPIGYELSWVNNRGRLSGYKTKYHAPDRGITLFCYDTKDPRLGSVLGAFGFFDLVLKRNQRNTMEFFMSLGAGIGYNTAPYDQYENNQNIMLGSDLGFVMQTKWGIKTQLYKALRINTFIGWFHISNGAIKLPNAGLNIPHIGVALQYNLGTKYDPETKEKTQRHLQVIEEQYAKKWSHEIHFKVAWKQGLHPRSQINAVYGITYLVNRSFGPLSTIQAGIDIIRNHNIRSIQKERVEELERHLNKDFHQGGIYIGHLLKAGRTDLVTGFGYYVYRPYKNTRSVTYQRYGLNYHISSKLLVSWILVANGGAADYIEYKIGYKL